MINKVIVLGNNHHNTLGLVRSLGHGGMDVTCLIVDEELGGSFVGKSKYIQDFRKFSSFDAALNYLKENATNKWLTPVFTTSDAGAEYLDSHYDELRPYYLVNNCGQKRCGIGTWMDKEKMLQTAEKAGLTIPIGQKVIVGEVNKAELQEIMYPCIIKPEKSSKAGKENVRICNDKKQFLMALDEIKNDCQEAIVQEYIDREYEFLIMGMRSRKENIIVLPGGLHKLRTCKKTSSLGMFAYAYTTEEIDEAINVEAIKHFLETIDYDGIFSIEFMISKGKAYFLEINLRNDGTQFCFEGAGVNLPMLWIKASKGMDITSDNKTLEKKYCMVEVNYLKNMEWYHLLTAIKEWWNTSLFALWDNKDWRPALYKLKYAGKRLKSRIIIITRRGTGCLRTRYLIRLDDACPFMFHERWERIEEMLDEYGVKPLVGIIPANSDTDTMRWHEDGHFWEKAINWEKKAWEIALHGYDHICISHEGLNGLNPVWVRSEFAGLPLEEQRRKIRLGGGILKEHGLHPKYFFAPSHTYDMNTLEALRQETDIRIVSDTYSLKPYKKHGFAFIPCQLGHPKKMKIPGLYTICLHPNNMDDVQFEQLESFLKSHQKVVLSFCDLDFSKACGLRPVDHLVQWAYFTVRRFKGVK